MSIVCQTTRAASAAVIRRRRPDGRHRARRGVADAAPILEDRGFIGGDHCCRQHRQALWPIAR